MSEKQLDFVHIFDQEPEKKPEPLEENNFENEDPIDFNDAETQNRAEVEQMELLKEKKEKRAKLNERRMALMLKTSPKTSDFEEFLPEIDSYMARMAGFRRAYEEAVHPEKIAIYEKLVRPDIKDDPIYQESARMYLKYIEALREEERPKRAALYDVRAMAKQAAQREKAGKKREAKPIDLRRGKNAAAHMDD